MTNEEYKPKRIEMLKLSNEETHQITVESIEQALILLLEENELSEIPISAITKKAGVSRTSFYANYTSKGEILKKYCDKISGELIQSMTDAELPDFSDKKEVWIALFAFLQEKGQIVKTLFQAGLGDILLDRGEAVLEVIWAESETVYDRYFIAGAYFNIVRHWILGGMKETPEEMAAIVNRL